MPPVTWVAASIVAASNLPLGSGAINQLVFAGSPDARGRPFEPDHQGPYPGGSPNTTAGGCGQPCAGLPVAFRRPGVGLLRHPVPAEDFSSPHGRPTSATGAWTATGLPRSAGVRRDRGGPLLYPGAAVSSRPAGHNRSAPAALQRPALHPRCHHPSAREAVTRHQRRFTQLTRPIFPLPVPPGRNGKPSAFPRASHPAVTSDACRGGNRPHRH